MHAAKDTPASAAVSSHNADTPSDAGGKGSGAAYPVSEKLLEDEARRKNGDLTNDAVTKTMTDQAKKAGDGPGRKDEGLNSDS